MSFSLDPMPTNHVIFSGQTNTGISQTGFMFGNPISSYDINSMQNTLLHLLTGYMKGNINTASVDLDSSVVIIADSATKPKVYNIRATIYDEDTKQAFMVYCPEIALNLPSSNRDEYLQLYYKVVAYQGDRISNYQPEPGSTETIVWENFYKYGYRKSSSTYTAEEILPNDILDNQMDSEVSVRYGIMWTLKWESQSLSGYKPGPIVALYRYKASSARFLFNTTRQFAYNTNLVDVPTIYARTAEDYIVLDGVYDMLMTNTDESVFKANVVFDQTFSIGTSKNIVVGVKDAPNITLEYRLIENTIVDSSSKWAGFNWVANKPYLMHCADFKLSYNDPSTRIYRKVQHYKYNNSGKINFTGATGEVLIEYYYNTTTKRFIITPNKTYTIEGTDHYFDGTNWKTSIPAGTLIHSARANILTQHKGFVRCDGGSYDKLQYSELFNYIGENYGGSGSNFKVPKYNDGRFFRNSGSGEITDANWKQDSTNLSYASNKATFTLSASNIPTLSGNTVSTDSKKYYTNYNTLSKLAFNKISLTPKWKIADFFAILSGSSKSTKAPYLTFSDVMVNHYHYDGIFNDPPSDDPDNPVYLANGQYSSSTVRSYFIGSTYSPSGNVASDHSSSPKYAGITSKVLQWIGSDNKVQSSSDKIYLRYPSSSNLGSTAVSCASVSATPSLQNATFGNETKRSDYHRHEVPSIPVTIPNANTPTAINVLPNYAYVGTFICLGQPLIVPETPVSITTESQGTAYTAPSISAELYASSTGNTH